MPASKDVSRPTPYWSAPGAELHLGDVRACLRRMPTRSVHCCISSPPYWGLRDYGTGTWEGGNAVCDHVESKRSPVIGSSSTLGFPADGGPRRISEDNTYHEAYTTQYKFVCHKCGAKRVDHQIGAEDVADCLGWATGKPCGECYVCHLVEVFAEVRRVLRDDGTVWLNLGDSYSSSNGNLVGAPWRAALALQSDGWVLRAAMPWIKRNAMPDSAENRPGRAVEDVFLLAKGKDYYYDGESIKQVGSWPAQGGAVFGKNGAEQHRKYDRPEYRTRNFRSSDLLISSTRGIDALDVPSASYKGAHYATFPVRLITPMILAGTSDHGACAECGCPYEPVVSKERTERVEDDGYDRDRSMRSNRNGLSTTLYDHIGGGVSSVVGWRKVCGCRTDEVVPCTVLDPFVGSGTTVATAIELGRHGVGIDLSEAYLRDHAVPRIEAAIRGERVPRKPAVGVRPDSNPPPPTALRGT